MKELSEKEMQRYIVLLLKKYISFCELNELTYYIAYGSLLGAVRHKGFIPWDNDLDVMMPRDDYKKFINLAKDNQTDFEVKSAETTQGYMYDYAKVTDSLTDIQTIYIKDISGMGLFIDVFPMDPVKISDDDVARIKKRIDFNHSMMIMAGSKKIRKSKSQLRMIAKYFAYIYSKIRRTPYWLTKKAEIISNYSSEFKTANRYIVGEDIITKEYFDGEPIKLLFEGVSVTCPNDTEGLLHELYGNYMELPPLDERVSTHDFKAYKL